MHTHMVVIKPTLWPHIFGGGAVHPSDSDLRHYLGFWLAVSCLFVLAINDGAAKLLSQLNNGGLQGLMGSFINGCQRLAN